MYNVYNKGKWSAKEHVIFERAHKKHGNKWIKVADVVKTRSNTQCKDHFKYLQLQAAKQSKRPSDKKSRPSRIRSRRSLRDQAKKKRSSSAAEKPSSLPSLLVVGTVLNVYLLYRLSTLQGVPTEALLPAQIFCFVNGFRCLFPNRYNGNIVLHDTPLSSIFLTRTLATAAEIAWIFQLAWFVTELRTSSGGGLVLFCGSSCRISQYLLRSTITLFDAAAWSMVVMCVAAQLCVWLSLLLETVGLMWYEEALWAGIFVLNTVLNAILFASGASSFASGNRGNSVIISLLYAVPYLTFQIAFHLPDLARQGEQSVLSLLTADQLRRGVAKAMHVRNQTSLASAWGGTVGLIWMTVYWVLLPVWPVYVAELYQTSNGTLN